MTRTMSHTMIRTRLTFGLGLAAAVLGLAACSSTPPVHYHTLLAPPRPAAPATVQSAPFLVDVLAVGLGEEEAELVEPDDGGNQTGDQRRAPHEPHSLERAGEWSLPAQIGAEAHGEGGHDERGRHHRRGDL